MKASISPNLSSLTFQESTLSRSDSIGAVLAISGMVYSVELFSLRRLPIRASPPAHASTAIVVAPPCSSVLMSAIHWSTRSIVNDGIRSTPGKRLKVASVPRWTRASGQFCGVPSVPAGAPSGTGGDGSAKRGLYLSPRR